MHWNMTQRGPDCATQFAPSGKSKYWSGHLLQLGGRQSWDLPFVFLSDKRLSLLGNLNSVPKQGFLGRNEKYIIKEGGIGCWIT